jgi:hypothetical protein
MSIDPAEADEPDEPVDFRPVAPGWQINISYADRTAETYLLVGWLYSPRRGRWLPTAWDGELIFFDQESEDINFVDLTLLPEERYRR